MLKIFRRLKSSEFKRNFAIVFSGSIISQFISLSTTPWQSRLYTPEEYGIYGLFLSISLVLGTLSTFRYSNTIQITKQPKDAECLIQFCCLSVFTISVITLLILLILYPYFISLFITKPLGFYIFLLPVEILLVGLAEIYLTWLNRNKDFKQISYNRVLFSIISNLTIIIWAYVIDKSFKGLIIGLITGQTVSVFFLYFQSLKFNRLSPKFEWANIILLLREYKNFPIYALPADLMNVFTNQLPVFMLNSFVGNTDVGYFNMSNKLLGLPTTFIGSSISEVFRQRATEDYHNYGSCRAIFLKTFKTLFLISVLPFLVIMVFGPWLFSVILGEHWREAGNYSRFLSLMFFLRFCISPLTYIYYITNKQKLDLLNTVYFMASTFLIFYLGYSKGILFCLILYSINYSLIYIYVFFTCYSFSEKNSKSQIHILKFNK